LRNTLSTPQPEHISVCICTFRRPELLGQLLTAVQRQRTDGRFDYSIVVVDNDDQESARPVVTSFVRKGMRLNYAVEPRQNISLARNRAIADATGDYIAMIDDDEIPDDTWLLDLYRETLRMSVDGVLAPVLPKFCEEPPVWVVRGGFFDRPAPATGHVLRWTETRSGNVLMRRAVFQRSSDWFDPALGSGGEDREFFRRKIAQGFVFAWTNDGAVREWVPAARWGRKFLMKRALLRGKMSLHKRDGRALSLLKSMAAVPAYCVALPVAALLGAHAVMTCLVRACDHLGKLLALLGMNPVRELYVQACSGAYKSAGGGSLDAESQ
jgi:succinoglycan biosynthesis protein ExoM